MNVFELVGQMSLKGADKVKEELSGIEGNLQKASQGLKIAGAAFTAVGVAGLKFVSDAKQINATLSSTAITLGITTKELRALTLATTNVTFPIKSVAATFDILTRAGVRDTEILQKVANAFDALADATGSSAEVVASQMIPTMKTFGLTAEEIASKTDMMTYLTKNSTLSLQDFDTMVGYVTPDLVDMGLTVDDLAAALIHMEKEGYAPGRVMTREFMKATTLAQKEGIKLTEALGLTSEELEKYKLELAGATGLTDKHAEAMNKQYSLTDKVKQKFSELTLVAGSFLEPLEPILAAMTALGPIMIFASSAMGAHTIALVAHRVAVIASTIAQWAWNAAMTANPIGLVIVAIGALIAAGIALYKNWDKVKNFFEGLWIDMKIIFAEGVKFIVNTVLLPFVEMVSKEISIVAKGIAKVAGLFNKELGESIDAFADKMWNARQEITDWADNLAEGARIEKGIRDTERALVDVNEALDDTNEISIEATGILDDDFTPAIQENIKALQGLKGILVDVMEGQLEAREKANELRKEWEYERSEAGKLGLSIRDVQFALLDMGWTAEQVQEMMSNLGDKTDTVNGILMASGKTALEVAAALLVQKGAVDNLTEAYEKLGSAPTQPGEAGTHYTSQAQHLSEEYGMSLEAAQATIDAYAANPQSEEFADVQGIMQDIVGYAKGGPILGDTLLTRLSDMRPYAVAHDGEHVTPSGQMMTVIFEMDGRCLGRAVMPYVVGETRLKQGIKI